MDKILVSACLLGDKCTYKGGDNKQAYLEELNAFYDLVPFCCEVEGGLTVPRLPSEIKGNAVIDSEGKDVTSAFRLGVYKASSIVSFLDIRLAILKENSPSCGPHFVHDGSFHGRLIKGQGLLARELARLGVRVMNEEEGLAFLEELKKQKALKDEKTALAIEKENAPKEEEKRVDDRKFSKGEDRKPFKKPYEKKGGKSFGKKPYGKSFDKKPYGKKPYSKSYDHKDEGHGEKKKDYGVRKPVTFNRTRRTSFKKKG